MLFLMREKAKELGPCLKAVIEKCTVQIFFFSWTSTCCKFLQNWVATALTKISELVLFKWPCLGISVVQKRGLKNEFILLDYPHCLTTHSWNALGTQFSTSYPTSVGKPNYILKNLRGEELSLTSFRFGQMIICWHLCSQPWSDLWYLPFNMLDIAFESPSLEQDLQPITSQIFRCLRRFP